MLQLNELSYRHRERTILHPVSLDFEPGKLYGILGPNGSGKTTLLKGLCGIWAAESGQVQWEGENLLAQERSTISQTIAMVPQNPQPTFDFTVRELIEMGRYCLGPHERGCLGEQALEEAMASVDVLDLADELVTEISTGERQRVYIARSLVTECPILVLDEPTANLDIAHQLEIWSLLRRLVQRNRTIIVTTHDLQMTERYCDSVAVLKKGRCLAAGPYANVMSESLLEEVFGVALVKDEDGCSFELPLKELQCSNTAV